MHAAGMLTYHEDNTTRPLVIEARDLRDAIETQEVSQGTFFEFEDTDERVQYKNKTSFK
jgi:hypothetical protein